MITTITTIEKLIPKYDYSKDNCYLVFSHTIKETKTVEIKAEWFDVNYGEKVLWLLVREKKNNESKKTRYRNVKFKNIEREVKLVKNRGDDIEQKK